MQMPYFAAKAGHEPCEKRIRDYLERAEGKSRALAHDFVNIGGRDMQRNWGYLMDKTRNAVGNGRSKVSYHHFLISPDPRDGVSLEQLREVTMEWVHEFFGDEMGPGRLGSFEVAVVYHDDNKRGIPHAHIIVNNVNLEDGKCLHLDNKTNSQLMPQRVQEIAQSHGLRFYGDGQDDPAERSERYYTKEERNLIRQKKFCWKEDLANNLEIARRTCTTIEEVSEQLDALGIRHWERDGDWVYAHPSNPDRWKVSGYRLGKSYTKDRISETLRGKPGDDIVRSKELKANVESYVTQDLAEIIGSMELVALVDHSVTVKEAAAALAVNDAYGIRSMSDYTERMRSLSRRIERIGAESPLSNPLRKEYNAIARARATAEKGTFFAGVNLPPARTFAQMHPEAFEGGRGSGGAGRTAGGEGFARSRARDSSRSAGRKR